MKATEKKKPNFRNHAEEITAILNHNHHSPFEKHLHPECLFCNDKNWK